MEAAQLPEPLLMSEAEYLAFADEQEIKYEFRNGRVYAMSGGSVRHGAITMNIGTHLNNLIGERNCTVLSADVRVQHAQMRTYRYPDVTVFCGDPIYREGRTDTITNPMLLVEVLSPESALRDHNEKLEEYTSIETLQAYLIISQDRAKVALYRLNEAGEWVYEFVNGLESEITVPLLGEKLKLSLAQIYRRIEFDAEQETDGD
jgi:Uma2 family endonuclease